MIMSIRKTLCMQLKINYIKMEIFNMKSLKKVLSLVVVITFISTSAKASIIYASAALKAGYGSIQTNDSTTVPKTNFTNYSIDSGLGLKMFGFIFGANAEYSLWKQLTEPSEVSNINSQGKLLGISPMIGFEFGPVRFIGKLPSFISGGYTLEKANSSGQTVKYTDADTLSLQFHWKFSPLTFWGLEYQTIDYNKVDIAGTESTLASGKNLEMSSIGLLYGIYF